MSIQALAICDVNIHVQLHNFLMTCVEVLTTDFTVYFHPF